MIIRITDHDQEVAEIVRKHAGDKSIAAAARRLFWEAAETALGAAGLAKAIQASRPAPKRARKGAK